MMMTAVPVFGITPRLSRPCRPAYIDSPPWRMGTLPIPTDWDAYDTRKAQEAARAERRRRRAYGFATCVGLASLTLFAALWSLGDRRPSGQALVALSLAAIIGGIAGIVGRETNRRMPATFSFWCAMPQSSRCGYQCHDCALIETIREAERRRSESED